MPKRYYTPTGWENEVPNGDPVFSIIDTGDVVIAAAATIEMVNEVVAGTPVNATNMNHIETGIENAQDTANEAIDAADAAQGSANLAQEDADTALANAATALSVANAAQEDADSALALVGKLPHAKAIRSASLSLPDYTFTTVPFDAENMDTNGFIDLVSNPDRITIPPGYGGVYLVGGSAQMNGNASGAVEMFIHVNGAGLNDGDGKPLNEDINGIVNYSTIMTLSDGDDLTMEVKQTTGTTKSLIRACLWLVKIY